MTRDGESEKEKNEWFEAVITKAPGNTLIMESTRFKQNKPFSIMHIQS